MPLNKIMHDHIVKTHGKLSVVKAKCKSKSFLIADFFIFIIQQTILECCIEVCY